MDSAIQWSPGITLDAIEKQVILTAFRFYRGNKTATSTSLGISIRTLDNKLDSYKKLEIDEVERKVNERHQRNEFLERARGPLTPNNINGNLESRSSASAPAAVANEAASGTEDVHGAAAGIRVESATAVTTKPAMSMPERQEVQEMSSRPLASSSANRRR